MQVEMARAKFADNRVAKFRADEHVALGVVFTVDTLAWYVVLADWKPKAPKEDGTEFLVVESGED